MIFYYIVLLSVISLTYGVLSVIQQAFLLSLNAKEIKANVYGLYFILCRDNSCYADGNCFCAACSDLSIFMNVATVVSAAIPILCTVSTVGTRCYGCDAYGRIGICAVHDKVGCFIQCIPMIGTCGIF